MSHLAEVLDALILAWLVATWFYEGHHRRCSVNVTCPQCGATTAARCTEDHRP